MNQTLRGLAVLAVLSATAASADDWNHDGYGYGYGADYDYDDGYRQGVPVQGHPCGPRPTMAPQGQSFSHGRYELQTVQTWVPGQTQQVYVPGQCHRKGRWHQRCSPGTYRTVTTAGHYVAQQQWVWVASYAPPPPPPRRVQYGMVPAGFQVSGPNGSVSVSVF